MVLKDCDNQQFLALFENSVKDLLADGTSLIAEGMRYAVLDGGKRIRPLCVYLGAKAVGKDCDIQAVLSLAMGIELVHSYSLVHDDLPAMDNDDYRRGKLSVHKKFGHANGILIGDALLSLAMSVLLDGANRYGRLFARASQTIAKSAEIMVLGQEKDLQGCNSESEYLDMYSQKTGALIEGAFRAGAILAGASDEQVENIAKFAQNVGISFQLADDLLDNDGVVAIKGADGVKAILQEKSSQANLIADGFANATELKEFVKLLSDRKK